MKSILFLISALFFASCATLKQPEFVSYEGVKMGKIDVKQVSFTLSLKLKNPNSYALKVKKNELSLSIDAGKIGTITLDKQVKLPRKKETIVDLPLRVSLEKGALLRMMTFNLQDSIKLNLDGDVRGGISIFSKKVPISFTKTISPKVLNPFKLLD